MSRRRASPSTSSRQRAAVAASPERPGAAPHASLLRVTGRARLIALVGTALIAFTLGMVSGAERSDPRVATVERFGQAWENADHATMYALLDDESRRRVTLESFSAAYRRVAGTLTLATLRTGPPRKAAGDSFLVPVTFHTRIFGPVPGRLRLTVAERDGGLGIAWRPHMAFPGMTPDARLTRETELPPRGSILARDGTPLAEGPDRLTSLGTGSGSLLGHVGPAPPAEAGRLVALGFPPDARVGLTGLERTFDARLAGRPGGRLLLDRRVVARADPVPGRDLTTTIEPSLQASAVEALAGRVGGSAAIDPRSGEVLALAGLAADAPQPPGSVFKIITLAAALQHAVVEESATFPEADAVALEGVRMENADGELCGGTLRDAFAHSCNSVFAPLGVRVGAQRLVRMAEAFGFNTGVPFAGAQPSTIPPADEIGGDLAVGSTAIGQGRVLATSLHMANVAATIADGGVLRTPTLELGRAAPGVRVVRADVARAIASYMGTVVQTGTGTAAAIPGGGVAGKTGTAELRSTVTGSAGEPAEDDPTDTDAWFAAFAPLDDPAVAVAVMLVGHGRGGETAAPAARVILDAALQR